MIKIIIAPVQHATHGEVFASPYPSLESMIITDWIFDMPTPHSPSIVEMPVKAWRDLIDVMDDDFDVNLVPLEGVTCMFHACADVRKRSEPFCLWDLPTVIFEENDRG